MSPFIMAGLAFMVCAIAGTWTGRLRLHQANGVLALSQLSYLIDDVVTQARTAYIPAAFTAYFAWRWWTGGGGDDTKRRLKRWASRFQGVRRTAPQGA
jgi:hypothetical protein